MMTSYDLWNTIVNAALMGSDRQPLNPAYLQDGSTPLAAALAGLEELPAPAALLRAAAVLSAYRSAGRLPEMPAALPEGPDGFAEVEPPRCSPQASRILSEVEDSDMALLDEFLTLLVENKLRPPEEHLPILLHLGRQHMALRPAVIHAAGNRGAWLARANPDWAYAARLAPNAQADVETAWQTAPRPARVGLLEDLRRSHPDRARELLSVTWYQENAADRATFLQALTVNLSLRDETFLEAALDDRSKEVHRKAAALLARLPGSALVGRMSARLLALLSFSGGRWPLGKAAIRVSLPAECTPEMLRDGIEPGKNGLSGKSPGGILGERAYWLSQMIGVVPPAVWSTTWKQTPTVLLEAAAQGEWKDLLHNSWLAAAGIHPDPAWIEALLERYPLQTPLAAALPRQQQESLALTCLNSRSIMQGMGLLRVMQFPWSRDLSLAFFRYLSAYYPALIKEMSYYQISGLLKELCRWIDPSVLPEAERLTAGKFQTDTTWDAVVLELLERLKFRQAMHRFLLPAH